MAHWALLAVAIVVASVAGSNAVTLQPDESKTLSTFMFGSCNKHTEPQPAWDVVASRLEAACAGKPDCAPLVVLLGDLVYADTPFILKLRFPASMERLKQHYDAQKARPEYADFIQRVAVAAVYDDHDFGANDGSRHSYSPHDRQTSISHLLDFLDEPADSLRRREGRAYTHYVFGSAPRRVRLILLDNRAYRDTYGDASGAQDMLGPEQWAWLERVLSTTEAEVTIIGTGLQFLGRNDALVGESWSRIPESQARMLAVLARHGVEGAFFLSGDVHFAELSRADTVEALGYPLYDFTSSGLTHSWEGRIKSIAAEVMLMSAARLGSDELTVSAHTRARAAAAAAARHGSVAASTTSADAAGRVERSGWASSWLVDGGRGLLRRVLSGEAAGIEDVIDRGAIHHGRNVGQVDIHWVEEEEEEGGQPQAVGAGGDVPQPPRRRLDLARTTITFTAINVGDNSTRFQHVFPLCRIYRPSAARTDSACGLPAAQAQPLQAQAPLPWGETLLNGLRPPPDALTIPLAEAVDACSRSSLQSGFTPHCARVMLGVFPRIGLAENAKYVVGHAAVGGAAALILAVLAIAPVVVVRQRKQLPGGAVPWLAICFGVWGALWAFLQSLG